MLTVTRITAVYHGGHEVAPKHQRQIQLAVTVQFGTSSACRSSFVTWEQGPMIFTTSHWCAVNPYSHVPKGLNEKLVY